MKFLLTPKEKRLFLEQREMLVDDFFSEKDLPTLLSGDEVAYDLFRTHPDVLKLLKNKNLLALLTDLTNISPLRIAADEIVTRPHRFQTNVPFEKQFCLQGLHIAFLLCLKAPDENQTPLKEGSLLIFQTHRLIDLSLFVQEHGLYYLACYGQDALIFRDCQSDPHHNVLRKLNQNLGDRLTNATHPLIF